MQQRADREQQVLSRSSLETGWRKQEGSKTTSHLASYLTSDTEEWRITAMKFSQSVKINWSPDQKQKTERSEKSISATFFFFLINLNNLPLPHSCFYQLLGRKLTPAVSTAGVGLHPEGTTDSRAQIRNSNTDKSKTLILIQSTPFLTKSHLKVSQRKNRTSYIPCSIFHI